MKKMLKARIFLVVVATITLIGAIIFPLSRTVTRPHAAGDEGQNCGVYAILKKGQTAIGSVSISTSDAGENGEGEGAVKVSDNEGNNYSFTGFGINHPFQITATADGDVVGVCYSGDGDETINVQVKVNSFTPLSLNQKTALADAAQTLSYFGTFFGAAVGVSCLFATGTAAAIACYAVGTGIPIIIEMQADKLNNLAGDPSDPNCAIDKLAKLSIPTYTTKQGLTPSEASAANAVVYSMAQEIALESSLYTTLNRYQGAVEASKKGCATLQLSVARLYAGALAGLLKTEPKILAAFSDAFTSSGFPTIAVTPADVSKYEADIAVNGLSSQAISTLTNLGANSSDISEVQQLLLVQDPSVVSSIGGGKFPQGLTDPSVTNGFLQSAQTLEQFAQSN